MACIKEYLLSTKMWVEAMVFLKKRNVFKEVYDEGYSPLSPFEWDGQRLPGLGEGLGCWLGWFRRELEGLSPSYKDRFVILHYLYS
jgi:hypothetical protein